ncbi:hypothetical protein [Chlamydia gallinacea]|uniref:hypothetical protein n=1 Tax=Chlamydia gallinacea TaxID=1457153 RepID=UPI0024E219D0|nr:hypothetical protein [Chlamydia gallinacea]
MTALTRLSCCSAGYLSSAAATKARKLSCSVYDRLRIATGFIDSAGSFSSIALASLSSSSSALPTLRNIESACCMASGVNNLISTGALFSQLITGAILYESEEGNFTVQLDPLTMTVRRVVRPPLVIISKLLRLFSKTLNSAHFLGHSDLKIIRLGAHAKIVGGIGTGLGALSSTCSLINDACCLASIHPDKYYHSQEDKIKLRQVIRETIFSFICNLVDIATAGVSIVFSFAPVLLGTHALLILGIFSLLSSVLNLVQDIITG